MSKKKTIAFIPVRGGSKSIPLKNVKSFCGKPLIYWNIEALSKIDEIDSIVVATDSQEIRDVVQKFNFGKVEVYDRDPKNAQDHSSTEDVMLEYINKSSLYDEVIFMLVQATSPLTRSIDFARGLELFSKKSNDSILSAIRTKNFYWNEDGSTINYDYMNRPRRQDFDGIFQENGAFYINSVMNIKKSGNRLSGKVAICEMPEFTAFEIDEPDDWIICEQLMYKHNLKKTADTGNIKLFLTDVDGVLTDAGMYYSENGDELKKFNTQDGKGIELLRKAGVKVGIITSEKTNIVERRAEKLNIDYLYQGISDKLTIAKMLCRELNINLGQVAYIGDDINDYELLMEVGLAATPKNGVDEIKNISNIIKLKKSGGEGAVREFISIIV